MTMTRKPPPKVRACLFDMDGLLIDSERIYTEATNAFLAPFGKGPLPPEVKVKLMGRLGPDSSKLLGEWAGLDMDPEEIYRQTSAIQEAMWPKVNPLPGAETLIQRLISYNIPIALATSSHRVKYELKTGHLQDDFFAHFPSDRIVVGDDPRIPSGRGKPHPDIFLLALSTINDSLPDHGKILPEECLVFEDAMLGVKSARSAGMQVVWVPDPVIKAVLVGEAQDILGEWGKEVASLEDLDLEEYGIGPPGV